MKLRVNPATGRLAEKIPADAEIFDGATWYSWEWVNGGLVEHYLYDSDVSDWLPVVLAPKQGNPQFAFAVACEHCDPHGVITDVHERDRLMRRHEEHDGSVFAMKLRHPGRAPDRRPPTFMAGAAVTFHGSTTGGVAGLVPATVVQATELPDEDGVPVAGYVVDVDGQSMFVPATALAKG